LISTQVSSDPFAVQGDAFAPAAAPSVSSSSLQDPAAAFRTPGPSPFEQAIANRRAKTEAQKKPEASSSSYETDSESDEESSASEESPVKAPRPSDNSELMNRFRSRLQASGSRSPPKRYASDSD
jgi:DNA primase